MRRLLAAAGLLLAVGGAVPCLAQVETVAPTADPDPRSLALATKIIDISFPPDRRNALILRRMNRLLQQIEAATAATTREITDVGVREIHDRYVAVVRREAERVITERSPVTFAAWARAYARACTHAELVEIRAFVATPAGTSFVQRIGEITSDPDVMRTSTASMTAVMAAIQPLEDRFEEELRAYAARQRRR
ncbi:MAG TPA: hypothetical protein VGO55_11860 [Allosphingosinicella sp.]|jgi:hypothetical protein|nr:hypothetical protein [Allosphingosinicella sp.]